MGFLHLRMQKHSWISGSSATIAAMSVSQTSMPNLFLYMTRIPLDAHNRTSYTLAIGEPSLSANSKILNASNTLNLSVAGHTISPPRRVEMTTCQRCSRKTKQYRYSWYNDDRLCLVCSDAEKSRTDYAECKQKEAAAVRKGNFNYHYGLR